MSEHLNSPTPSSTAGEASVVWVRNGQRIEDIYDRFTAPQPGEAAHQDGAERRKRRARTAVVGIAAVAITATLTAGYYTNAFNIQPIIHEFALGFMGSNPAPENGMTMHMPLVANPDSLSADQCMLPGSVYAVATISGTWGVIGKLANKDHPTTSRAKPYMTKEKEKAMAKSDGAMFDKFVTGGYPEVTLNNMPLGLTICDLDKAIEKVGDTYTIDRSKLQILFEDPTSKSMFSIPINAQPQLESKTVANLDPSKGEWVTYPTHGLFLYDGKDPKTSEVTDPVLNKSVTGLVQSMQDPQVLRTLIAIMEEQAVTQFSSTMANKNTVTYSDSSVESIRDAIDALLSARIGNVSFRKHTDYSVKMDVPIDHTTTKKITEKNAITTMDLDPKNFRLTKANVVSGFPDRPKSTPSPTPSPTVTKTTTP